MLWLNSLVWLIWRLLFAIAFFGQSYAVAEISVIDDMQVTVTLKKPAQRIISLAPHITESLFAIGAGQQIVGVISHSDYPQAAAAIPVIASYNKINYEAILNAKPDIVIAWGSGNGDEAIARLKALGLVVYVDESKRLNEIVNSLQRLGILSGNKQQAFAVAQDFIDKYQYLKAHYAGQQPTLSVYYEIWSEPRMTLNDKHIVSDIIRLCGGRNLFADAIPLVPKISMEAVIRRNPDVIILSDKGRATAQKTAFAEWLTWPLLNAVQNRQLHSINPDLMVRQSTRILDGAEHLCEILEQAR